MMLRTEAIKMSLYGFLVVVCAMWVCPGHGRAQDPDGGFGASTLGTAVDAGVSTVKQEQPAARDKTGSESSMARAGRAEPRPSQPKVFERRFSATLDAGVQADATLSADATTDGVADSATENSQDVRSPTAVAGSVERQLLVHPAKTTDAHTTTKESSQVTDKAESAREAFVAAFAEKAQVASGLSQYVWLIVLALALIVVGVLLRRLATSVSRTRTTPGFTASLLASLSWLSKLLGVVLFIVAIFGFASFESTQVRLVLLIALGFAIGYSIREVVPDLVAFVLLYVERRVRAGMRIESDTVKGTIERITLRSVHVREDANRADGDVASEDSISVIPNRRLLARTVRILDGVRGTWSVELVVDSQAHEPATVRSAIRDATLISPYLVPGSDIQIAQVADRKDRWNVVVFLRQVARADAAFRGSIQEHLLALLSPDLEAELHADAANLDAKSAADVPTVSSQPPRASKPPKASSPPKTKS